MPVGESGRVVVDIGPVLKRRLHAALVADGMTLKEWFIAEAERYLADRTQPNLFGPSHASSE